MATLRYPRFSLQVPDDWQDRSQVFVFRPDPVGFAPNLNVTSVPKTGASLGEFAAEQRSFLERGELQGFRVLEEGLVQLGEREVFRRVFTAVYQAPLTQLQLYVEGREEMFVFTGTATPRDFPRVESAFLDIVRTFTETPDP